MPDEAAGSQDIPENQSSVLSIPGGTGGEQGRGQRPWQAIGQPGLLLSQAEQQEGRSNLSQSTKPRAHRAGTASLGRTGGHWSTQSSSHHREQPRNPLYPGAKREKQRAGLLSPG